MAAAKQIAIVRAVPSTLAECELTHQDRAEIDLDRARRQHGSYETMLSRLGCTILHLPMLESHPDSVFVEDTMLVLPEVAVALRPGAASRRGEVQSVVDAVGPHRSVVTIDAPATIDGGDLLVLGRSIYLGLSSRSSNEGADRLQDLLGPLGYTVHGVPIEACLHLKSAVTALDNDTIICNPEWVDPATFRTTHVIECDPSEPHGANVLPLLNRVIAGRFPMTNHRIQHAGFDIQELDLSELAKAEGAVTCCSIILGA